MLFAEGVSHLLQVLLVMVSLAELSEAGNGHPEPVFSRFFPLQFLEQLDVFFALRVDLARFNESARVKNGFGDVSITIR